MPSKRAVRLAQETKNDLQPSQEPLRNKILLALSKTDCSAIFPKLEFVSLPVPTVLNEAGEPIKFAYFINDGLASVLTIISDGKSIEVGLSGSEGFVGLPLIVGFTSSHTRVIMQVAGSAFRMKASYLKAALQDCPALEIALQRHAQQMAMQASQVAACNRIHEVDERLARWLLMSQDRLGGEIVPLTQEFLAHMLGTRRASVTVAAGVLQRAGLITYSRGSVKVRNRSKLEDASCECYQMITQQAEKWQTEASPTRTT
jgi:CRP-like cAMP-binding protein